MTHAPAILYLDRPYEKKQSMLPWQRAGLQQTASGYGKRLTSSYMLRIQGERVWRRIYVVCYSNAGSAYVVIKGQTFYLAGE